MIQIEFSEEEKQALHYERFHHPHPRVQLKMEVLWLKSQGLSHPTICRLTRISENTLRRYLRAYLQGGLAQLKQVSFHQPQSELLDHQETLEAYFREHPPVSVKEAAAHIERLTGVQRGPSQVRHFLKSLGMSCRKVGMLPAKVNPDVQEAFKKNELEPRLEEAKAGQREVFFVDAAHFVFGAFLGMLWCFARVWIPAPSGRQRWNVLGAIHAVNHQLITVTNRDYINAKSVCDLLQKIAALGFTVPVTLVLDNARYQRCALVQELAQQLQIELLFLPAYSPNLNLIERLWKFTKKQCLYSHYYSTFDAFQNAISHCLAGTQTTHKAALDSLLQLHFQSFSPAQPFQEPPLMAA